MPCRFTWMLLALAALARAASSSAAVRPPLVLWAWERPEDLRFIDPAEIGVAYLAGTTWLDGSATRSRPRLQPLRLPDGIEVTAVVRVETRRAALTAEQARALASEIAHLAVRDGVAVVQVDFDAALSQRAFYVEMLGRLRPMLREGQRLEITVLASWCLFDDWIARLPAGLVDGVVPMAFRMGLDDARVRRELAAGRPLRCEACRESLGIAVDEALPRVPSGARIYAFNPRPWTADDVARLRGMTAR